MSEAEFADLNRSFPTQVSRREPSLEQLSNGFVFRKRDERLEDLSSGRLRGELAELGNWRRSGRDNREREIDELHRLDARATFAMKDRDGDVGFLLAEGLFNIGIAQLSQGEA